MLLMLNTTFARIGDIADYRWDFPAFCIYTIWICIMTVSIIHNSKIHWKVSGIIAGILLFVRCNSIVYVILIVPFFLFFEQTEKKYTLKIFIRKSFNYMFWIFIGGGWFLCVNFKNFFNYYFYAYTSSDQVLWQLNLNWLDNILYYPRILLSTHLGIKVCILLLFGIFIAIVFKLLHKSKMSLQYIHGILLAFISLFVPLSALTISKNKNGTVISIICGVCVFVCIVLFSYSLINILPKIRGVLVICGVGILFWGLGSYFLNCMHVREDYSLLSEKGVINIHEAVCNYIEKYEIENPTVLVDRFMDEVYMNSFNVYYYEKNNNAANITNAITHFSEGALTDQFNAAELKNGLNNADFVIVSENGYTSPSTYPTDILMDTFRNDILGYAREEMTLIAAEEYNGNILSVFAKRQSNVTLSTTWQDWLGISNTTILFEKGKENTLIIEGINGYSYENPQIVCNISNIILPTKWNTDNSGRYQLAIDISNCTEGLHIMTLSFNDYFIPSETSGSTDTRQLTIMYPDNIYMK